jgi:hypothetical protein
MRADLPLLGVTWGNCAGEPRLFGRLSDHSPIAVRTVSHRPPTNHRAIAFSSQLSATVRPF